MTSIKTTYQGETWNLLSLGATNAEGKVFAHLAHPTRKIGIHPVQVNDWIELRTAWSEEEAK